MIIVFGVMASDSLFMVLPSVSLQRFWLGCRLPEENLLLAAPLPTPPKHTQSLFSQDMQTTQKPGGHREQGPSGLFRCRSGWHQSVHLGHLTAMPLAAHVGSEKLAS